MLSDTTEALRSRSARLRHIRERLRFLAKGMPLAQRAVGGVEHGALSAAAALLAYLPTQAIGLKEGFWAAITALAVTQTEFGATRSTARDQFVGAAVGGFVGWATSVTLGDGLPAYGLAVTVAMTVAWLLNVASAGRLAAITATIILIVPHTVSAERMLASRLFEVGWGIAIAVLLAWLYRWLVVGGRTGSADAAP